MGCTVTASILSQKDWVDSSKFLENNSSKDKIHTILPPSLHPKKKGHHLTTMKLWNIDAGPRTFSSKRQLATGRIPHSGGSLVWVPPPIRCGRQWRSVSFRYVTWRDEVLLTGPLCFQTGLYKCFWKHPERLLHQRCLRTEMLHTSRFFPIVKIHFYRMLWDSLKISSFPKVLMNFLCTFYM